MWKCNDCGKTFPMAGRISSERRIPNPLSGSISDSSIRIIVEKACCPYCESINFEKSEVIPWVTENSSKKK